MKLGNLNKMIGGWFIGDFEPNLIKNKDFEASVKYYKKGDKESKHMHKVATEITVIESGRAIMKDTVFNKGDIILLEPGEATSFEALDDTTTFVIKFPSVKDDKYLVEDDA